MNTVDKKAYLIGRIFGSLCDMCGMYNMIRNGKYDDSKIHCMENNFVFTPESTLYNTQRRYDHIMKYARSKNLISVTVYDKSMNELAKNFESIGNVKISLLDFIRGKNDTENVIRTKRTNNKNNTNNN